MRKVRKLCIVLSLLLVLSFFVAAPAFAADLINTTAIYGFGDSGNLKVSWNVYGIANDDVDKGKVTVQLQKYSGSWSTVKTVTEVEYNDDEIDNVRDNVSVSSAGNYRLKTVFYAENDGATDTFTKWSASRYLN